MNVGSGVLTEDCEDGVGVNVYDGPEVEDPFIFSVNSRTFILKRRNWCSFRAFEFR